MRMKEWLDRVPAGVALVSAFAFAASAIREFAYFAVVGPRFQSLMEFSDYVRSALGWLPVVTIAFVLTMALQYPSFLLLHRFAPIKLEFTSPGPASPARIRFTWPWVFFFGAPVTVMLLGIAYIFLNKSCGALGTPIAIGGAFFLVLTAILFRFSEGLRPTMMSMGPIAGVTVLTSPILVVLFGYFGVHAGCHDLNTPNSLYSVRLDGVEKELSFLRAFSSGILVREKDGRRAYFVPSGDVKLIASP